MSGTKPGRSVFCDKAREREVQKFFNFELRRLRPHKTQPRYKATFVTSQSTSKVQSFELLTEKPPPDFFHLGCIYGHRTGESLTKGGEREDELLVTQITSESVIIHLAIGRGSRMTKFTMELYIDPDLMHYYAAGIVLG